MTIPKNLGAQWADLQSQYDRLQLERSKITTRLAEMEEYQETNRNELERLNRTRMAGDVLADIKITHCPACDRQLESTNQEESRCLLCCRPFDYSNNGSTANNRRIEFEYEQLSEEVKETADIISRLREESEKCSDGLKNIAESIAWVEVLLRPVRTAAAAIIPPELSVIDQETGRLEEQIRQLGRIKNSLKLRDELSEQIDAITHELSGLEAEIAEANQEVSFSHASDVLAEGINSYLNALNSDNPDRWPEGSCASQIGISEI